MQTRTKSKHSKNNTQQTNTTKPPNTSIQQHKQKRQHNTNERHKHKQHTKWRNKQTKQKHQHKQHKPEEKKRKQTQALWFVFDCWGLVLTTPNSNNKATHKTTQAEKNKQLKTTQQNQTNTNTKPHTTQTDKNNIKQHKHRDKLMNSTNQHKKAQTNDKLRNKHRPNTNKHKQTQKHSKHTSQKKPVAQNKDAAKHSISLPKQQRYWGCDNVSGLCRKTPDCSLTWVAAHATKHNSRNTARVASRQAFPQDSCSVAQHGVVLSPAATTHRFEYNIET